MGRADTHLARFRTEEGGNDFLGGLALAVTPKMSRGCLLRGGEFLGRSTHTSTLRGRASDLEKKMILNIEVRRFCFENGN